MFLDGVVGGRGGGGGGVGSEVWKWVFMIL